MPYESIDELQKALTNDVFHYANDPKKAAGRALGTLVEIVTFYLIKSWGYEHSIAIERRLPEYANHGITHNVEFSFHSSNEIGTVVANATHLPLTPKKIHRLLGVQRWPEQGFKANQLVARDGTLRNACTLYEDSERVIVAYLVDAENDSYHVSVHSLSHHPFAVIECKRVGVEEGVNKGPQTIEKAKQGAYVARTVSSLQKIRMNDGALYGVLHLPTGELQHAPYQDFLRRIIQSNDKSLLADFTLTVGVVSNHGNWFTAGDQNKELKVLSESYDWPIFLTDDGLSQFVKSLIVQPAEEYEAVRDAFLNSYDGTSKKNRFTKVNMQLSADLALRNYFAQHLSEIEGWFNLISPVGASVSDLRRHLNELTSKAWETILP